MRVRRGAHAVPRATHAAHCPRPTASFAWRTGRRRPCGGRPACLGFRARRRPTREHLLGSWNRRALVSESEVASCAVCACLATSRQASRSRGSTHASRALGNLMLHEVPRRRVACRRRGAARTTTAPCARHKFARGTSGAAPTVPPHRWRQRSGTAVGRAPARRVEQWRAGVRRSCCRARQFPRRLHTLGSGAAPALVQVQRGRRGAFLNVRRATSSALRQLSDVARAAVRLPS